LIRERESGVWSKGEVEKLIRKRWNRRTDEQGILNDEGERGT
jgi:hypothetical protein